MSKKVAFLLLTAGIVSVNAVVVKTGQTRVYRTGDDGTYRSGVAHSYSRYTLVGIGDVVDDAATNLTWTDFFITPDDQINAAAYCSNLGSGWRLPSIEELRTLVESNTTNSAYNPVFQEYEPSAYWTSTMFDQDHAWFVSFENGFEYYYYNSTTVSFDIRCVSDTSTVIRPKRTFSRKNGVVYDSATNLSWQDDGSVSDPAKTMDWTGAVDYCENLNFAGTGDWKLPNKNELLSITDMNRTNPAIDTAFQNTANDGYWASSTLDTNASKHWQVNFAEGNGQWLEDSYDYRANVRCVREGKIESKPSPSLMMYLLN